MITIELKPLDEARKVYYLFYTFEPDWKPDQFIPAAREAERLVDAAIPSKLYSVFFLKRKAYTANIPGIMQMIAKAGANKLNDRIEYTYIIGTMDRVIQATHLFVKALRVKVSYGFYDSVDEVILDMQVRSQK
jgi:hypothetical protein